MSTSGQEKFNDPFVINHNYHNHNLKLEDIPFLKVLFKDPNRLLVFELRLFPYSQRRGYLFIKKKIAGLPYSSHLNGPRATGHRTNKQSNGASQQISNLIEIIKTCYIQVSNARCRYLNSKVRRVSYPEPRFTQIFCLNKCRDVSPPRF